MGKFVNLNGEYLLSENPVINHNNRAFLYGDALFETMHANGTKVQFFKDHLSRLMHGLELLKMKTPSCIEYQTLEKEIEKLLRKNKHLKGARVRLTVFRNEGGKYTPATNETSYLVDSEKLDSYFYKLNEKGLLTDFYTDIKKPVNFLSGLKTTNDLLYTLAGIFKTENNLDECILVNQKNEITEAISSNIFTVKGEIIKTPPLKSGCLNGIMRKKILDLALKNGFKISADKPVLPQDLLEADEIFLTNAVKGIQWVGGVQHKRFYKTTAKLLIKSLNELAEID
jgi:branched-chain amino acid aminotransferase